MIRIGERDVKTYNADVSRKKQMDIGIFKQKLVEYERNKALVIGAGIYALKKKKGKSVPLQAWSGPEGSRKLRFPDFMTTAQQGGKVVSLTHRPYLPPGNSPGTHFC